MEGNFLVDEESGNLYELNEEATVVLAMIAGEWMSPERILELLSAEWELEDFDKALEDVREFLESLCQEGVVEKRSST